MRDVPFLTPPYLLVVAVLISLLGSASAASAVADGAVGEDGKGDRTAATTRRWSIMPFGDSLTTCCHYCAVVAGILPPARAKELAEQPMPYSGYIRYLWHGLRRSTSAFTYVGRVTACIKNSSLSMRVPDDWEVRYEGYYGFTTQRLLNEKLPGALKDNRPDAVLLIAGTNDMIATQGSVSGASRLEKAFRNLKLMIKRILISKGNARCAALEDTADPGSGQDRGIPHIFLGVIPPIDYSILGGTRAGRALRGKGSRVAKYNRLIRSLFTSSNSSTSDPSAVGGGANNRRCSDAVSTLIDDIPDGVFSERVHLVEHNLNLASDFHGDGLHPNHKGEQRLAAAFEVAIRKHLFHMPSLEEPVLLQDVPQSTVVVSSSSTSTTAAPRPVVGVGTQPRSSDHVVVVVGGSVEDDKESIIPSLLSLTVLLLMLWLVVKLVVKCSC